MNSQNARWLVPAAITIYLVSLLPPSATPILVTTLIEFGHFDGVQAGFIATASLFALALGTMCVAGLIGRVSNRKLTVASSAIVAFACVSSAFLRSFYPLAALQLLAGLGFGILYGTANAAMASSADPDRLFAKAIVAVKVSAALMLFVLPFMLRWFAYAGVFYFLAAAIVLALPLMARVPDHVKVAVAARVRQPFSFDGRTWAGVLVVAVTFLFFVVNGVAWTSAAQTGASTGLSLEKIGFVLGTVVTVGTLGPLIAAWLGTRYGRLPPLLIGVALNALGIAGLAFVLTPSAYIACLVVFDVSFLFIHPYLLGIASELDKTGRWVVTASSLGMAGFGLAPAIAGLLTQHFGMASIAWLALLGSAALLLMLVNPLSFLKRAADKTGTAAVA